MFSSNPVGWVWQISLATSNVNKFQETRSGMLWMTWRAKGLVDIAHQIKYTISTEQRDLHLRTHDMAGD